MKNKLELYFTRDVTLSMAEFWHALLAEDFVYEFGLGINDQIAYFNGRAVEIYRQIDTMDKLEKYIIEKGVDNEIFSKQSVEKFRVLIARTLELLEQMENADLQTMVDNFDESILLLKKFFPWVLFANMLPSRWREGFLKKYPDETEEIFKRWYKARVFSEGKFELIDSYWRRLTEVLLNKQKLDKKFSRVVRLEELKQALVGNNVINVEELEFRLKGYIFYQGKFIINKDLSEFLKDNNFICDDLEIDQEVEVIKGQIAMTGGILKGVVQSVFNADEVSNFKKGNILVSAMTTPDFVPAMKKATAIITDEGGITCHAAIVSRELGIPCIIGTKIATHVLKDGDEVEVDAVNGTIRKIPS